MLLACVCTCVSTWPTCPLACTAQVSGVGNDSIFMGVMRPYVVEENVIRVWCTPSGGQ